MGRTRSKQRAVHLLFPLSGRKLSPAAAMRESLLLKLILTNAHPPLFEKPSRRSFLKTISTAVLAAPFVTEGANKRSPNGAKRVIRYSHSRMVPTITIGTGEFCTMKARADAVWCMVSVPCPITMPWTPRSISRPIAWAVPIDAG